MRYKLNMKHKFAVLIWACLMPAFALQAQVWRETNEHGKINLGKDLGYTVEAQATASSGQTPLWLNANKHGLSSLEKTNAYLMAGIAHYLPTRCENGPWAMALMWPLRMASQADWW